MRRLTPAALALVLLAVAVAVLWFLPRRASSGRRPSPALAPAPAVSSSGPIRFADVSQGSGVGLVARNGEEAGLRVILESLGTGVALLDYDGDGLLDIFAVGGGTLAQNSEGPKIAGVADHLFRNLGGWSFRDVTADVRLTSTGRYGHGCAVGDYDNDGDCDLVVTGYGGVTLYRNDGGRAFADVTRASGLDRADGWCTSAAWADFDNDGRLDLYIVRYVDWSWSNNPQCRYRASGALDICAPTVFHGQTDLLFHNEGGGRFVEVGARAGLNAEGKGLGVVAADFDGDRAIDLYVANDTSGNFLYRNRGNGTFEDVGTTSGAVLSAEGIATGSMGVEAGDFDGDGDLDIWVTNYEGEVNELYRNEGGWVFTSVSLPSGLGAVSRPMVGWGTALADFDNDGLLDVFVANGHLMHHLPNTPRPQRPLLHRQTDAGGRFLDIGAGAGPYFAANHIARGCAAGDLDNDGDLDLVITHLNGPMALLRNDAIPHRPALRLRLEGVRSNRSAIGAVVVVTASGRKFTRAVVGGGSYLSSSDGRLNIGLGGAESAERVEVRWPSGATDVHGPLAADRPWLLREGEAEPRPASAW